MEHLWMNLPILLILLPLISSPILAAVKPRAAKAVFLFALAACVGLSGALVCFCAGYGRAYTISMGEVGAPFGNELFVSSAEAAVSLLFTLVMLLSVMGGLHRVSEEIRENRRSLFYTVCALLTAALNAMTFTNDIFTGYVFLEIMTIGAGALIFVRSREGALFAAMRYMLMNLLGSGLFLLGLAVLYCLTGHLLFPQMKESVRAIVAGGRYVTPLTVSLILITLGLSIKSALYPFHTWLPNAYSGATSAASSILSSLVSKAYIFLYIKIIVRGVGAEPFLACGACDVTFAYACVAIVMGSVDAIREHNVRRMVSYSSVAQIGYIFLAISLGTPEAMCAAVFHIFAHSSAKAMLFPAVDRLTEVSGGNENYRDLRGSGFRAPVAGVAFVVGAFSITGIPLLGGFSSKVYISAASVGVGGLKMALTLAVLALSTVLNVIYFLRTVITIYRQGENYPLSRDRNARFAFIASMIAFVVMNLFLGMGAQPVMELIRSGMSLWT